jgi:hypothetical protein
VFNFWRVIAWWVLGGIVALIISQFVNENYLTIYLIMVAGSIVEHIVTEIFPWK